MSRQLPPSITVGVLALTVLALIALWGNVGRSSREVDSPLNNHPAPALTASEGAPALPQLEALRGKVVLLNFWATWCGPCRRELPDFVALHRTYGSKGLALLGGVVNDDMDKANAYAKDNEMDWPQFPVTREIAEAYGGLTSVPTTVLIDKKGVVNAVFVGTITRDDIEGKIKALL